MLSGPGGVEPSRIVQDLDTQSVSLADTLRRELGNVVEEAVVRTLGWGRFPKQVPSSLLRVPGERVGAGPPSSCCVGTEGHWPPLQAPACNVDSGLRAPARMSADPNCPLSHDFCGR